MYLYKRKNQWKKFISWLLIFCVSFTSVEWPIISDAETINDSVQVEEGKQIQAKDVDAGEESSTYNSEDFSEEDLENLEKTEILEERTPNSKTWQLSNGMKQTIYYSDDIPSEELEMKNQGISFANVEEEVSDSGESLEKYAYVNTWKKQKYYIPDKIGVDTPLLLENGNYSLKVSPLFTQNTEIAQQDKALEQEDGLKQNVDSEQEEGEKQNVDLEQNIASGQDKALEQNTASERNIDIE